MNTYRLEYLEDVDGIEQTTFNSPAPVQVGDLIPVASGYHHQVIEIVGAHAPMPLLRLGKSGQGPAEASLQTLLPLRP